MNSAAVSQATASRARATKSKTDRSTRPSQLRKLAQKFQNSPGVLWGPIPDSDDTGFKPLLVRCNSYLPRLVNTQCLADLHDIG